ncbi:MAG: Indole-3-glycerol phosphate synthase [Chlamydiae bacterium]|nr:Indole-3-glycerol phosphate synthase [Chlamydiota bacterium]
MNNELNEIVANKQKKVDILIEIEKMDEAKPLEKILSRRKPNRHHFRDALKVAGLSVIAEIKREDLLKRKASSIDHLVKLSHLYSKAGAAAISVLTDEDYFGGSMHDLMHISQGFTTLHPCPILSKDFIIDPYQIAQSKKAGASAVLLIVAVVKDRLREFLDIAEYIGVDALVEVHNEEELNRALEEKASIIGVCSRDLKTREVNLDIAKNLAPKIPKGIIKIAESGILNVEHARAMHECGYDGVLIGEMLVNAKDPRGIISEIGNI